MLTRSQRRLVVVASLVAAVAGHVAAQTGQGSGGGTSGSSAPRRVRVVPPSSGSVPEPGIAITNPVDVVETAAGGVGEEDGGNELVVAPLPLANPALGTGLGLVAVYTFARDGDSASPPTTLGVGGFFTENGSWSGGAGVKLYVLEDRLRATVGAGLGVLNYDLATSIGSSGRTIPICQEFDGALAELMVGLGRRWYGGLRLAFGSTTVSARNGDAASIPLDPGGLDVVLASIGIRSERDSRDSVFYPTAGAHLEILVARSDTGLGSDFSYSKTTVSFGRYVRLGEPVVLALHTAGCSVGSGAPFFDLCLFGSGNVLRGYTTGRHLDSWSVAVQSELRWRFARRWIATSFVGLGAVEPEYSLDPETELLPAAGVGLHWVAAPDSMITVRAEYAVGEAGSNAFYIGIGQAF